MELTEDEVLQKYGEQCSHCSQNTLLPYEYERTCVSCGNNVIKRKHELTKIQRRKKKFYQSIELCGTQNFLYLSRCI